MKNYHDVISDLDEVTRHIDACYYQTWKQMADELGIYLDESINNRLRNVSRMEGFEVILKRCDDVIGEADKIRYTSKKNEIYKELLSNMSPSGLSSEMKETLDKLRENGLKLVIGSSGKDICLILEWLGLGGYSDAISDGNQTARPKPDSEVFLLATELIGEEPEHCLVVEDAKAGLIVAKADGMDMAGVGNASDYELADYRLVTSKEPLATCNYELVQSMLY